MPTRPRLLAATRAQPLLIGVAAAALAIGGFEAGRKTVDAAAVAKSMATIPAPPPADLVSPNATLLERDHSRITVREIATVPFSELYDVLRSASREQRLAWARDLERMPRGPRQRAAVAAYYKSLIQVDHRAAIEAILRAENLNMRDVAIDALPKAAPESIWEELAEMMLQMPYQARGSWFSFQQDVIFNWSRVDPRAVSKFIESHPENNVNGQDDRRLFLLMFNWAEIDPTAARAWLEADASRQTKDAFRAFVRSWAHIDRAAAIDYAVANARRPNFDKAINDLAYDFVRLAKEDATRLILLLPPDQAKAAMKYAARVTTSSDIRDLPSGDQRLPDQVARWMVSLPVELWDESVGDVAQEWLKRDAVSATAWFDQLRPDLRDVAIVSFCRAAKSGEMPAEWVMEFGWKISDRRLRDKTLGEVARSLRSTREEAIEAVNKLSISDEQKAYLRKIMTEGANGR